jgi:hypothetical protein
MSQKDLFDYGLAEPLAVKPTPEPPRASTHRAKILDLLKQGSVTNFELAEICIRYSARIHELRQAGYEIETGLVNRDTGLSVYRLKEQG